MVNTRSGFNRESRFSREETNEYSGDEDNMSVVDHFAENVNGNEDLNDMREVERDHEKHRIEQRFMEMNRQISELTSIVRALTDKISNSREENYRDAQNSETSVRSDNLLHFQPLAISTACNFNRLQFQPLAISTYFN